MEIRSLVPLDSISDFPGIRDRPDESMKWLKEFIYVMDNARWERSKWIPPFELHMKGGDSDRYAQLDKKTRNTWSLLVEAFKGYFCSGQVDTPNSLYYNAERRPNEHLLDYMLRLNRYARRAGI